jgi:NitT/TauT family transport system substrate-binding protein
MRIPRGLLAALLAMTACGGSGASQATQSPSAPIKLTVAYSEIYEGELPVWVTMDAGLFAKHGLDVDLQYIASSTTVPALISGQTKVSQGGGSEALSAIAEGADLVVIGSLVPVYPYVFEAPLSIKTVSDLKGKKVGVSNPGSASDIATRIGLKREGLDPDKDLTIVAVGSSQNRTAALKNGSIQGGLDQLPYSLILERSGFHPLFDMVSLKLPTVNNGIVVRRSVLKSQRDAIQRYIDAIVEGIARMKKDKAFSIAVYKKYLKLDDDPALSATYDYAVANLFPSQPLVTPEQFADSVTVLSQKNSKVRDVDLNKVIDNSLVKSAVARVR